MGAEPRAGDRRVDEAAVVAAHDRDAVAGADAVRGERAGERVGAAVQLAEAERAELVDQRRLVRRSRGGDGDRAGGGGPPAHQRAADEREAVGADRRDQAGVDQRLDDAGVVEERSVGPGTGGIQA